MGGFAAFQKQCFLCAILCAILFMPSARGAGYLTLAREHEFAGLGGERMTVHGNRLHIQRNNSLAIYGMANLEAPQLLGSLSLATTAVGMQASMAVSDALVALTAYPTGGGRERVYLVDVTNPSAPQLASSWELSCVQMALVGEYLYVATAANPSFRVYDVSSPASPQVVFSVNSRPLPLAAGGMSTVEGSVCGLAVHGTHVFTRFGTGWQDAPGGPVLPQLVVWDATDPAEPVELSALPVPTVKKNYYADATDGDSLIFPCFFGMGGDDSLNKGATLLDVAAPSAPVFGVDMDWDVAELGNNANVLYAIPVAERGGAVFVFADGLAFLDISDPTLPLTRGIFLDAFNDAAFLNDHIAALKSDRLVLFRRPALGGGFSVYSVSPGEAGVGGTVVFNVAGFGFSGGVTVALVSGEQVLTPGPITLDPSGLGLTAQFDLSQAAPGQWALRVTPSEGAPQELPVSLSAGPAIFITSVSPAMADAWGTATFTVAGSGFGPDMTARLTQGGRYPAVSAEAVSVTPDGTGATITFNLTGVYPGPRTLELSRPGRTPGELPQSVDVRSVLDLAGVTPPAALTGQTSLFTLNGAGFLAGDIVRLVRPGSGTITGAVQSVAEDGGSMTVAFDLADDAPANADVWGIQVLRATGERLECPHLLTVYDSQASAPSVTPQMISGFAGQVRLDIASAALHTGASPMLYCADRVLAPVSVDKADVVGAVFTIPPDTPPGSAKIVLEQGGVQVASKEVRIVAGLGDVRLGGESGLNLSGEGFVEGCAVYFVETGSGARIDASTVTVVSSNTLLAAFSGGLPAGTWTPHALGPNGRDVVSSRFGIGSGRYLLIGEGVSRLSLSTQRGGRGGMATVTVYGEDMGPPQWMRLKKGTLEIAGADLFLTGQGDGEWTAKAVFDLTDAEPGLYDFVFQPVEGAQTGLPGAFTVEDMAPKITLATVMPANERAGREARGKVVVQNQGNVDAFGYLALRHIPTDASCDFTSEGAGSQGVVVKSPEADGNGSLVRFGELMAAAGTELEVGVVVRRDRGGLVTVEPEWVGVHRQGER